MTQLSDGGVRSGRRSRAAPFYGWAMVAVGAVVRFCFGRRQSCVFPVFLDPILADTGISRTRISALYAVGTGVSAIMVSAVGRLVNRLGARDACIGRADLKAACLLMASATGALTLLLGFRTLRVLGQASMGKRISSIMLEAGTGLAEARRQCATTRTQRAKGAPREALRRDSELMRGREG